MTRQHKNRLLVFVVFLLLLSGSAAPLSAYSVPEKPDNSAVYDDTGLITAETREYLIALNDALYDNCRGQTVIALFTGIGGEDIAEYAKRCFNDWGIGDGEYNRGVLFLMSAAEDDYWAVQGKGLEDSLTSGELGTVLDEFVEPYFAAKDYDGAARGFAEAVYKKLAGIYGFSGELPNDIAFSGKTKLIETAAEENYYGTPENDYSYTFADRIRDFFGGLFGGFGSIFVIIWTVIALIIIIRVLSSCSRGLFCSNANSYGGCCWPLFCCGDGGGYSGGWHGSGGGSGFGGSSRNSSSSSRGGSSFGGRRPTGGSGRSSGSSGRSSGGSRGSSGSRSGGFSGGSTRGGGAGRGRR